jgi:oligopeptide transport system ATP-binding protein
MSTVPLVRVENLTKYFPIKAGILQRKVGDVKAVDGVSFDIWRGETLGMVGESGCGKTTVGRTILRIYYPTSGEIYFDGIPLSSVKNKPLRQMRRRMQMVFQDPYASLNPRLTAGEIVGEPLEIHALARGAEKQKRVAELFEMVGLSREYINRYPHEFSGGQRQRIGLARALALTPDLIICDEPIAALDVSIQAQIVNLMEELQEELNLTYLFIAHDLSMVKHISDRVLVMYVGKVMELADREELYESPLHPYTKALLSAVPIPDPEYEMRRKRIILSGDLPSPAHPPPGCRFHTRCPIAEQKCMLSEPTLREVSPGHMVACHFV